MDHSLPRLEANPLQCLGSLQVLLALCCMALSAVPLWKERYQRCPCLFESWVHKCIFSFLKTIPVTVLYIQHETCSIKSLATQQGKDLLPPAEVVLTSGSAAGWSTPRSWFHDVPSRFWLPCCLSALIALQLWQTSCCFYFIYQRVASRWKGISSIGNAPLAFSLPYHLILAIKNSSLNLASLFVQWLGGLAKQELKASSGDFILSCAEFFSLPHCPYPHPRVLGNFWEDLKKGIFQTE